MDKLKAREFITEKITQNKLPIDIEECLTTIESYVEIYNDKCYKTLFFKYLHNLVGSIVSKYNHDLEGLVGWLEVNKHKIIDVVYFHLPGEDYAKWKMARKELYATLVDLDDLRILNYVELSTINFITDVTTDCEYELVKGADVIRVKQDGYNIEYNGVKKSFISFLGGYFKNGYYFKVV